MKNHSFVCGFVIFLVLTLLSAPVCAQNPLFSRIKKTIVIDAGHGGNDTGTRGTDGALEKEVTLSFAKSLEEILKNSYNVALTRTDDYYLDVHSRTETANRSGADLFISLHTGGNFIHESQGIGIFYFEGAPEARPDQTVTDQTVQKGGSEPTWNEIQEKYAPISRSFALSLSAQFSQSTPHRKIRVAGLAADVLSGADMPAIIIELGYMTSPVDEKRLVDPNYIFEFSKEISSGIDTYFSRYSKSF